MPGIKDLKSVWDNVKEIDLRPLSEAAEKRLVIALVGGGGIYRLAEALRSDPARPDILMPAPALLIDTQQAGLDPELVRRQLASADLVVWLVPPSAGNESERAITQPWLAAGQPVLVIYTQPDAEPGAEPAGEGQVPPAGSGRPRPVGRSTQALSGDVGDLSFLQREFAPAVMRLLPDRLLALGRQYPFFRLPVVHHLINDTCMSNAAYSLSTGLAEIVPIFDIPLNIADMVVLSKAQAFLVYKLGLALGLSTRWRDYVTEFGSVLGGGFLWRQIARSLIGLVPAWGIIPKVAVAYAGTYVVGNVVLQWYLTGKHVTRQQMGKMFNQALARGTNFARERLQKLPRPRRKKDKEVLLEARSGRICPACERTSAADAAFCQYCGHSLEPELT